MKITKFGHSCVLVEEGDTRLLLDPGMFSRGFQDLTGLAGILITHQHEDHLDVDAVRRLVDANQEATLVSDEGSADKLREVGLTPTVVHEGDTHTIGAVPIRGVGSKHAVIHPDFPQIPNVGYLIADRLYHPGDALLQPDVEVEILALPVVAPWSKVSETVEFVRAVAPRVAVPIHDAITTVPQLFDGIVTGLGPDTMTLRRAEEGPVSL